MSARDDLLFEALKEVPFSGFSDIALRAAAAHVGLTPDELPAAFPNGPASLVEAFSLWADAQMEARLRDGLPERIREKIAAAVRARIEAILPHKEAARRAAAFLAMPQHASLAAKLLFRSVDAMWRVTGDRSNDFNYYTKRALLAGVYGATLLHWLSDSSDGNAETWTFLDRRIDDVMKIQKLRGDLAAARFPDPLGIIAALRSGSRAR